jgi:hypothetical protein
VHRRAGTHAFRNRKWTPDQQRTTPQLRRAALHPGHAIGWLSKETKQGKSAKTCQAPFVKIFLFFRMANQR